MLNISTTLHTQAFGTSAADILKVDNRDAPWFRARKLFQLDVNYRWSPIDASDIYICESIAGILKVCSQGMKIGRLP